MLQLEHWRPAVAAASLAVAACAATGPRFDDLHPAGASVPADVARLVVFRSGHLQYIARAAQIGLDGADAGRLGVNSFLSFDLAPGAHRLVVDMLDAPGRCEVVVDLAAGQIAFVEVAPRSASFVSGAPGNLMASAGPQGVVAGFMVMLGGMAIESADKPCGGAFAMVPVAPELALRRVRELRAPGP